MVGSTKQASNEHEAASQDSQPFADESCAIAETMKHATDEDETVSEPTGPARLPLAPLQVNTTTTTTTTPRVLKRAVAINDKGDKMRKCKTQRHVASMASIDNFLSKKSE